MLDFANLIFFSATNEKYQLHAFGEVTAGPDEAKYGF